MSRRFPPERPTAFQVEGEYRDSGGATYTVAGRLMVTANNEAQIEGRATLATAGECFAPTGGTFHGRLDDGTEIALPHARLDHMNIRWGHIGSGWSTRLSALSHVDWVSQRAAHEDELDTDVTVWWTLTHSTLLWHAAKRFFSFDNDKMAALGVSPQALQHAMESPRPNPCRWNIAGIDFEIGWFEEKFAAADELTRYPVRATRFVPRARARTRFHGSSAGLLRELERAQAMLDRLLTCVGFLQADRVLWYERTEEAEVDNPTPPPARGTVHRCARLLVGRFPEASRDSLRALKAAPLVVDHAPRMVDRFAAGEPFTPAALDAYLLARETHHWPSRLILTSTALESLKELFLRSQPQRGILPDEHWSEVQKGLEAQLKQGWKDGYGPKQLRGPMKAKLRELNRPTYRQTLEAMVEDWGVSLDGCDDPFAFIGLRDSLVHTGQVPNDDYEALAKATTASTELFERLVAAWLRISIAGSDTGVSSRNAVPR
jgi:hypothetical protein